MTKRKLLDRNGHAAVSVEPKSKSNLFGAIIRFDKPPKERVCNASMREPLVWKAPAAARDGSEDAKKWPSVGGC